VLTRAAFPQNYTETLFNLGLAYRALSVHNTTDPTQKQTALQNAYTTFAQAIDTVEYLRGEITSGDEAKRKLNEEFNRLYLGMVEVCLELGNYTAAIEYADRSKARNLVELIATRDAYPEGQIPNEVHQRLQYLRQAIDEENRRLAQDPNPDYTHIDELRQEFQAKFPYKPLEFTQIQSLLDEETAILEWYLLDNQFLTFILTPDPPLTPPYQRGEQEKQPPLRETGTSESPLRKTETSEPPLIRGAGGISLWQSTPEDFNNLIDWVREYLTAYYKSQEALAQAHDALKAAKTEAEQQKAEQLLAEAQEIWQNPLSQRLEALAKILHLDEILHSLFKKLPTCKKLILIPHRYLHLFPLHALPTQFVRTSEGLRSIKPKELRKNLLDLFPNGVSYAPSCQLLQQAQKRPRTDFNQLFAIQNPTQDLVGADLEIETIGQIFPNCNTLSRTNAKKSALIISEGNQFQLCADLKTVHHLYFSCHAAFNPNSPLESGLLLADGVLTLDDILRYFNLSQCSLVTLSACETGQVSLDDTDEYISLSSGFILAGSPSLIVSQWSVDQISTALLLIKTYETLRDPQGNLKVAFALNTAQQWLRDTSIQGFLSWTEQSLLLTDTWRERLQQFFKKLGQNKDIKTFQPYQSPYHWAAFTAVGQGELLMSSDAEKIQAFVALIQENSETILASYWPSLTELKTQIGEDDKKNVNLIETWLKQVNLYETYQSQIKSSNPLLSATAQKAAFRSQGTPGKPSRSLAELIDQAVKNNPAFTDGMPSKPDATPPNPEKQP
jgi:CHAT domain-containing protein